MGYISVSQAADKWGVLACRLHKLPEEYRIYGALRFYKAWMISKNAEKPAAHCKTQYKREGCGYER